MVCPNCKHTYPISNGIPNMVSPQPGRRELTIPPDNVRLILCLLSLFPTSLSAIFSTHSVLLVRSPAARRARDHRLEGPSVG